MSSISGSNVADSVSGLEVAGALSARLAHLLSNHLSIISGNLSVAAAVRDDPEKGAAALQSALRAANLTGALLGQFVDFRRGLKESLDPLPLGEVRTLLETWTERNAGWSLQTEISPPILGQISLPATWLCFSLDSIVKESGSRGGTLVLKRISQAKNPFGHSLLDAAGQTGFAQITLTNGSERIIDWSKARADLRNWNLTAVIEMLQMAGGWPETRALSPGFTETKLTLPISSSGHQAL